MMSMIHQSPQPACRQKHEDTRSNFAHVKPVNPDGPEEDS